MDNWLKALVATACLVIILGGSYFAWSHYIEWKTASDMQAMRAQADRIERCKAYRDSPRPFPSESEGLARLKRLSCQEDHPELF
ncbi:MAG: hypothetical protein ACTHLK_09445 [Brucella intermedia]